MNIFKKRRLTGININQEELDQLRQPVEIMERIQKHTVKSSDQEELDQLQHDWWTG